MNEENLPIGDAFGEEATPEENGRIMREIEEWLREARVAKREQKTIDWLATAMLCGYIAAVICVMLLSMIWPALLFVGTIVLGISFSLNIGLVVAQVVVHRRRRASIIPTTGQEHDLTTQQK